MAISNRKDLEEFVGEALQETDMAVRLDIEGTIEWCPKSVLEDWPDVGSVGDILMPRWLAEEKEFT